MDIIRFNALGDEKLAPKSDPKESEDERDVSSSCFAYKRLKAANLALGSSRIRSSLSCTSLGGGVLASSSIGVSSVLGDAILDSGNLVSDPFCGAIRVLSS